MPVKFFFSDLNIIKNYILAIPWIVFLAISVVLYITFFILFLCDCCGCFKCCSVGRFFFCSKKKI